MQERKIIEYEYMPNMRDHEGHTGEMILNGFFVDKTEMYEQLLEVNKPVSQRTENKALHCCFPRRFGKTTLLRFIQTTLGLDAQTKVRTYEEFCMKLNGMAQGRNFLNEPIRPVVYLNTSFCVSEDLTKEAIQGAFCTAGVKTKYTSKQSIGGFLSQSVSQLTQQWENAKFVLDDDEKDWVDTSPIVLIDEYDSPWREYENVETKFHENYMQLITQLRSDSYHRLVIASLLRISKIGLSDLISQDIARQRCYHGVTGITSFELKKALKATQEGFMDEVRNCFEQHRDKLQKECPFPETECPPESQRSPADIDKDIFAYLLRRYNGYRFYIDFPESNEGKIPPDSEASVLSPYDFFVFLYHDIKVSGFPPIQEWRKLVEPFVQKVLKKYYPKDLWLEALCGGFFNAKNLSDRCSIEDYWTHEQDNFQLFRLQRLFVDLGYLCPQYGIGDEIFVGPNTALGFDIRCKALESIIGGTVRTKSTDIKLLEKWADPAEFLSYFKQILQHSRFTIAICNRESEDLREYEAQHYLLKIMGLYLFHESVNVRAEYHARSADNERERRIDIIIEMRRASSLIYVVIIELKFTTKDLDSTESNRKLDDGWNQAMDVNTNIYGEGVKVSRYSIVYHWLCRRDMSIRFRVGLTGLDEQSSQYRTFRCQQRGGHFNFEEEPQQDLRRNPRRW